MHPSIHPSIHPSESNTAHLVGQCRNQTQKTRLHHFRQFFLVGSPQWRRPFFPRSCWRVHVACNLNSTSPSRRKFTRSPGEASRPRFGQDEGNQVRHSHRVGTKTVTCGCSTISGAGTTSYPSQDMQIPCKNGGAARHVRGSELSHQQSHARRRTKSAVHVRSRIAGREMATAPVKTVLPRVVRRCAVIHGIELHPKEERAVYIVGRTW